MLAACAPQDASNSNPTKSKAELEAEEKEREQKAREEKAREEKAREEKAKEEKAKEEKRIRELIEKAKKEATLSFSSDDPTLTSKGHKNLTTFNSHTAVHLTVSSGKIPSGLESRVEAKLATNTTQPPSIALSTKGDTQSNKILTLNTDDVHSVLYLIEAKLFVRPSKSTVKWTEAKTASRQYARYFFSTDGHRTASDMLEIEYDRFIVAQGGEVIFTIKNKEDPSMAKYKHIQFELGQYFEVVFYIESTNKNELLLNMNPAVLNGVTKLFFSDPDSIKADYGYQNNTYRITLKGLKKGIRFRLALIKARGTPDTVRLPPILVK